MIIIKSQVYYAIYSRKSKFTGKGESIENQIELCKSFLINKYGSSISSQILIFQDEGFTGYNTNRPEFQKLMHFINEKQIRSLIVYRLDRISRNVSDFCNLKNELEKANVDFISVTENFDTSTPMGTAMLMITSVFAQLERDTIAERIKDNMYELAKTGRWLGGNTPLGFKSKKLENITIDGKKRYLYTLEPINEEIKIIHLIWDKMLELKSLGKLETYLLQKNIKTRNHNHFTRFSLTAILKNPVYVIADAKIKNFFLSKNASIYTENSYFDNKHGLIAYNKRFQITGKTKKMNDTSKWIIAVGKHEGIISSTEFITTWCLLENNQNKRFRIPPKNLSILSGVIKCSYCNSYMRPKLRNTYTKEKERNFSYLCELKDKSRKKLCTCPNLNGLQTDKLVLSTMKTFTIPLSLFLTKLKDLTKLTKNIKTNNELLSLKTKYTNNKLKITKLVSLLPESDSEIIPELLKEIKTLKTNNKLIKNNITTLETKKEAKSNFPISKTAFKILKEYLNTFDKLDLLSKRSLIKLLITSITTDSNNIYIKLFPTSDSRRSNS